MIKILFICHGNICRSPMAEFILKQLLSDRGIASKAYVASAATSTEEIGNPVYPPARRRLAEAGICCEGKRAVQLTKDDYEKYDFLIGMDTANIRNILRIVKNDPKGKVSRLLDFTDCRGDISDPWYTGDFEATFRDVTRGCEALVKSVLL